MSDDKNLPAQPTNRGAPALHENGLKAGSLIDASLARLNVTQTNDLLAKAAEERLRLEVKSHEQNMDYSIGRKTAEDHIDTFNMLEKNGRLTRQTVTSDINTGAGRMRIESKSGISCFVATVAYDDPYHPDVVFLRWFRDAVLANSKAGTRFIDWYWANGPRIAKFVGGSRLIKTAARHLIGGIVAGLKMLTAAR